jgi:hypothetical protein
MEGRTGASDWIRLWLLTEFVAAGLQNALSSGQIPEKDSARHKDHDRREQL